MSNRHLPAGYYLQTASVGNSGFDMAQGTIKGGRRRSQYGPHHPSHPHQRQHSHQHQHQHQQPPPPPPPPPQQQQQQQQQQQPPPQHMASMYNSYMTYAPQQYYAVSPQYGSTGMPSPGNYMTYQAYARSPPVQQYVPMAGVSVPVNYPHHSQYSPSLATPYQPPPAPVTGPPQTPSSTQSSQQMLPPPTPPTPHTVESVPSRTPPPFVYDVPEVPKFRPLLPWLSRPDRGFPKRSRRVQTKRNLIPTDGQMVSFPNERRADVVESAATKPAEAFSGRTQEASEKQGTKVSPARPLDSIQQSTQSIGESHAELTTEKAVSTDAPQSPSTFTNGHHVQGGQKDDIATLEMDAGIIASPDGKSASSTSVASLPVRTAPATWAKLFSAPTSYGPSQSGGAGPMDGASGSTVPRSQLAFADKSSLAEVVQSFRVSSTNRVPLIEPRGLINTGNMCYMNSVLQVLMFCAPFYEFLDRLSQSAAHKFKSSTPLVDVLVVFMQEFKVLASGNTSEQLQNSVRPETFEKYGEPFTPEFVYEVIRQLSRFASMEHGHQQDAEEFLGFLLQTLDDECTHLMNHTAVDESHQPKGNAPIPAKGADSTGDWLEVGRKQKAAVTRSSGTNSSTPITKIFGGLLRSELRVPGLKDSITTEPYQPLQLDIGSPDVRNVVDALRGLTRPERLQGDFNSPRGKDVMATKQVFIESLPPVLILHLKRFQFDAEGRGTIKIWKKVGYPLELEIPREVLSRQRKQTIGEGSLPRYKLISVVYHHGKNASGGHYTVDVRRQDGREWVRIDDTVLRRIRSEDVAEAGSEEDAKEVRREQSPASSASTNRFGAIQDEDAGDDDGWKQVTTSASGNKRWNTAANSGSKNSSMEKQAKDNIKDNKVAYLLFYQRM